LVTEVGCLRFVHLILYRAIPPHTGALLQQQQMQAPIMILNLTGHCLSYSGVRESQFTALHPGSWGNFVAVPTGGAYDAASGKSRSEIADENPYD
jgi:hypothetical protein